MRHSLNRGTLNKNDHVDFWYVQDLEAGHRLLLRAEMKIPGRAWLEFLLSSQARGRTLVRCCARTPTSASTSKSANAISAPQIT